MALYAAAGRPSVRPTGTVATPGVLVAPAALIALASPYRASEPRYAKQSSGAAPKRD
jgi:hypothetical protein